MIHSANTLRIYRRAQLAFNEWCRDYGFAHPVSEANIARYLHHVLRRRGATVVPVHLSAIGMLYRSRGWQCDTRREPIFRETQTAKRELRGL